MVEELNKGNTPEKNAPENPTEGIPVSESQNTQPQAPNPADQPAAEQAVGEGSAHQEGQSQPQVSQASAPSGQPVPPQGQQMNFGQPVVPPTVNPALQNAPARKELIVLPIISFVVSVITLILAWLAPLPFIYVIIAFLGIIYAIVGLIVNLKRKVVLSIIALVIASLVFLISGLAVFVRQPKSDDIKTAKTEKKSVKEDIDDEDEEDIDGDSKDSTKVQDYTASPSDYDYTWSESKFKRLKFAGYSGSKGGSSVKSIIKKFGKASEAHIDSNLLSLDYSSTKNNERVHLSFKKQYDGKFILSSGVMSSTPSKIKTVPRGSYKSNWTQADVDDLTTGHMNTGKGGTNLDDVIKKHGNPVGAREAVSSSGEGFKKTLKLLYNDYSGSDKSKLSYVSLEFVKQSNGDYLLSYKYPKGEN